MITLNGNGGVDGKYTYRIMSARSVTDVYMAATTKNKPLGVPTCLY